MQAFGPALCFWGDFRNQASQHDKSRFPNPARHDVRRPPLHGRLSGRVRTSGSRWDRRLLVPTCA